MTTLRPTVQILWSGVSEKPKSRLRTVTWRCLATPQGHSVEVYVRYRTYENHGGQTVEVRYPEKKAPKWIPRPPEGWLDSLAALHKTWEHGHINPEEDES